MIAEYKKNTNIGVGIGLVLQFVGNAMKRNAYAVGQPSALGVLIGLVGLGLFIWGCMNYAKGKGYEWYVGLLGILSCIGLIILVILPDKNPNG